MLNRADHHILLGHGAGGTAMRKLITETIVSAFANDTPGPLMDGARVTVPSSDLVFTTDSFVVQPIEFPGGDIGKLAVCGTVNDLAVMGAQPFYLSLSFILEEGLDFELLERIVKSIASATAEANVRIVTGDTKVVPRGQCDKLFINTSGIGVYPSGRGLSDRLISEGDAILLSGPLGDHAIAILTARNSLPMQSHIRSDCASLAGLVGTVLEAYNSVKWMRDPTRGGLAAVLSELVENQPFGVMIEESEIPVRPEVSAVCELLGFDPVHLACEGTAVMVVEGSDSNLVLAKLRDHPLGEFAQCIGRITSDGAGTVRVTTETRGVRRLHRPAGELLPRIC